MHSVLLLQCTYDSPVADLKPPPPPPPSLLFFPVFYAQLVEISKNPVDFLDFFLILNC